MGARAMRILGIAAAAALAATGALADGVYGVWQTEKKEVGRYLEVEVHPCADDGHRVCGTIAGAFAGADQANVGKPIIWGMVPEGADAWDDGKIWKVDEDEVYDSEMRLLPDGMLEVSGCILGGLICRSQDWVRVRHGS